MGRMLALPETFPHIPGAPGFQPPQDLKTSMEITGVTSMLELQTRPLSPRLQDLSGN